MRRPPFSTAHSSHLRAPRCARSPAVSDLAALQTFSGGHEFDRAIGATLAHYEAMLVTETVDSEPELGDELLPW